MNEFESFGWAAYTPILTQGNSIPKTIRFARYAVFGVYTQIIADLMPTASGIGGWPIEISAPLRLAFASEPVGSAIVYDSSRDEFYPYEVIVATPELLRLAWLDRQDDPTLNHGDIVRVSVTCKFNPPAGRTTAADTEGA